MRFRFLIFTLILISSICSTAFAQDKYIIGPEDVLEIRAWSKTDPDILIVNPVTTAPGIVVSGTETHSVTVSRDGRIYVPLVGVLKVDGLTVNELESILKKRLAKFAPKASVVVLIRQPKPVRVYVLGQVRSPGLYSVPDGNPEEARIVNFIHKAGGLTPYGNQDEIKVMRGDKVIAVNFRKIVLEKDLSQNIVLKPGDTVLVSSMSNKVYVLGQVIKPGAYDYIEGAKLIDYINMAGGPTKGAVEEVGVIGGRGKESKVTKVNIGKLMGKLEEIDKEVDIKIGDIIYVPQSFYANWADIVGGLGLLRNTFAYPRDMYDAYRDLTDQPRRTYVPTE